MSEKFYFVRTCFRNGEGVLKSPSIDANGFVWPEEIGSVVSCPDWNPDSHCGGGLHGLRPGDNDPGVWCNEPNAVWLVCSYDPETAVELDGKIKVPSCTVEYVVDAKDGANTLVPLWLKKHGVTDPIYRGVVSDEKLAKAGESGVAIVTEERGHAQAGLWGYAISSYSFGSVVAGNNGHAIAGHQGTAVAGHFGFAKAGVYGKATTERSGQSIVGDHGVAIAGDYGTAIAGRFGTAVVGFRGMAIVGHGGKAKAGYGGTIQIEGWVNDECHIFSGTILPEKTQMEPDTLYQLDDQGKFVKVGTPNE